MKKGTPILWQRVFRIPLCRLLTLLLVCAGLMTGNVARSQCGPGTAQATLNWEILDYLQTTANYTADNYINPTSLATTQNFAFGPANRLTIVAGNNITLGGDNESHVGETGSYGSGFDVQYTSTSNNVTVTLTFEFEVTNLRFSIYDIDNNQRMNVTAQNAASVAQNVAMSLANGASLITFSGNPGTNPQALPPVGGYALNSNLGTVNIDIAGPVRTVTLSFSNANGDFWLSDIHACVTGSFPLNYYAVAQPFTGQPGYVLHAFNEHVYYVDPATGFTRLLFSDNTGNGNVNSLAYDPYNRLIYYVYSLTGNEMTTLRRYDVNTGVQSTIVANLETIGLPTTTITGTESGSAGFYNGSYYIGVETGNSGRNSGREAVIWRIDFNGSNIPYRCSQVFAQPIDSSGLLLHDWSDFVMHDGVLYNFDAAENDRGGLASTDVNQSDIYHVDLMTGNYVRYRKPGHLSVPLWYPGQPAINWAGQVVQVFASSGSASNTGAMPNSLPYITNYDGAGGIGAPIFMNGTFSPANPSLGDAGEAFRPRSDFGDAPSNYDPVALEVATHEIDPLIRLGATVVNEWNVTHSTLADAEGGEENGIGAAPTLNFDATLTYNLNNIQVFNNTGAQARVVAWLDFNLNGVFEPFEGRASNLIPSSGSMQSINLQWSNIFVPNTSDLRTYLRIRITRNANGMTTSSMNGWFSDGEVEDFPVTLGVALPKDIQSFNVKKEMNSTIGVKWSINVQQQVESYEVLRSSDNENWTTIGTVSSRDGFGLQNYSFNDLAPAAGISYYRIRINYQAEGANKLSEVRTVKFDANNNGFIRILPNPAQETAELQISSTRKDEAVIRVYDRSGRLVMNLKQGVDAGMNSIRINNLSKLADGVYTIRTIVNGRTTSNQLIIKKQ